MTFYILQSTSSNKPYYGKSHSRFVQVETIDCWSRRGTKKIGVTLNARMYPTEYPNDRTTVREKESFGTGILVVR